MLVLVYLFEAFLKASRVLESVIQFSSLVKQVKCLICPSWLTLAPLARIFSWINHPSSLGSVSNIALKLKGISSILFEESIEIIASSSISTFVLIAFPWILVSSRSNSSESSLKYGKNAAIFWADVSVMIELELSCI